MADSSAPDGADLPEDTTPKTADPEGPRPAEPPAPTEVPVDVDPVQRRRLNVGVLLALAALAAYLLAHMVWPFLGGLGAALVMAVLAHPLYEKINGRFARPSLSASIVTTIGFLVVLLPLAGVSYALVDTLQEHTANVSEDVGEFLEPEGEGEQMLDSLATRVGAGDQRIGEQLREEFGSVGQAISGRLVGFLSGIGAIALQTGVALFTLFYFLRDGRKLMGTMSRVLPIDPSLVDALAHRSGEVIRATMFGNVAVGVLQGALGGLTFWLLGIPGPILWGAVMAVLGMLPIVGSPVVWGPASIILLLQGEVNKAVILFLVGALIISTSDNVLRSLVVGDRAQLHPLTVFVSVLGGVALFGVMGLFLGPLFFVLSISLLEVTHGVLQPDDGSA